MHTDTQADTHRSYTSHSVTTHTHTHTNTHTHTHTSLNQSNTSHSHKTLNPSYCTHQTNIHNTKHMYRFYHLIFGLFKDLLT